MSSDALLFITSFPKIIWSIFTSVKIPGLNFTPAVFFFGILTFGVVWRFAFSILHITSFFAKGDPDHSPVGNIPFKTLHRSKNYYGNDTWG